MSEGWQEKRLDELGFVGRGKSKHRPRNDASLFGGEYPFIQTGEIKATDLHISRFTQTYNDKGLAQSKLWEPGTLCITIAANIAETAILKISACFPDSIVGFIADPEKSDTYFVKYYLDTLKLRMQSISRGATQDNLPVEKLLSFKLLVPSVFQQRKISSAIRVYDDLIENNTRRIQILEEMCQRIYREWFVDFQFPGYKKVNFGDSEMGNIPEGWRIGALSDFVSIKSGFAFKSKMFCEDGKYSLVTIKNVQDGVFVPKSQNQLDDLPKNMPEYCYISSGDILLSLTGNVGRVCLVYGENYVLNQRVAKLVPVSDSNHSFIYSFFRSSEVQQRLEMLSTGVAQQNLSPIETGKLQIVIPSKRILKDFSSVCDSFLGEILNLYSKNLCLRKSRDLLLPKLISGEIGVSELDIDSGKKNQ
ncbi:MAG: restriction endonuclease subunit S [Candidatus Omnitrophica bacterium]|nr:restriction endonuclease subunit S [Candidatus Omnitrophota bacterium]